MEISEENKRVAAYIPAKNKITVDEKAFKVCESMGGEAENALAFLIGHELAHAFQKEVRNSNLVTNFLAYDKHYHAAHRTEKVADIQGVFTSYLAGYGAQKAIPKLLEKIYDAYQLKNVKLSNYPSFEDRSNSAKEINGIADDLIDLYEASNYLIALEENKWASECLEYIYQYYQGFEMDNSLGVNYLLMATKFFDAEKDIYAFPYSVDGRSELEKINWSRGERTKLQFWERQNRNIALDESIKYFEKALKKNPRHTLSKINKVCALNKKGFHQKAYNYLTGNGFNKTEKKSSRYLLALGITASFLGNDLKASGIFNDLKTDGDKMVALFAEHNYKILHNQKTENYGRPSVPLPPAISNQTEGLKLGKTRDWYKLLLNKEEGLYFRKNKSGPKTSYSIGTDFGNVFSMVVINDKNSFSSLNIEQANYQENIILTKKGFYLKSSEISVIVDCNKEGRVKKLIKYIEHWK